ncbi:MAG: hypothetical protein KKA19_09130, partial [Candidatus Margulisbacteria bacterium]|nr:hypothetical protein [Candidatus Margulisiibacteriota bacterium]
MKVVQHRDGKFYFELDNKISLERNNVSQCLVNEAGFIKDNNQELNPEEETQLVNWLMRSNNDFKICFNRVFLAKLNTCGILSIKDWPLIDFPQLEENDIQVIRKYLPLNSLGAIIATAKYKILYFDSENPEAELIKFLKEVENKHPGSKDLIKFLQENPSEKAFFATVSLSLEEKDINKIGNKKIAKHIQYALTDDEKYLFELAKENKKALDIINLHQGKYFDEDYLYDLALFYLGKKEPSLAKIILKIPSDKYKKINDEKLKKITKAFYAFNKQGLDPVLVDKIGLDNVSRYIVELDIKDFNFLRNNYPAIGDIKLKEIISKYILEEGFSAEGEKMLANIYKDTSDNEAKRNLAQYLVDQSINFKKWNFLYRQKKWQVAGNCEADYMGLDLDADCKCPLGWYAAGLTSMSIYFGINYAVEVFARKKRYTYGMSSDLISSINSYEKDYDTFNLITIGRNPDNEDYGYYRLKNIDDVERNALIKIDNEYSEALARAQKLELPAYNPPVYRPPSSWKYNSDEEYKQALEQYDSDYKKAWDEYHALRDAQEERKQHIVNGIQNEWNNEKNKLANYYKKIPYYWLDVNLLGLEYLNKANNQQSSLNFKYHNSYYQMLSFNLEHKAKIFTPLITDYDHINLVTYAEENLVKRGRMDDDYFPWQQATTLGLKFQYNLVANERNDLKVFLNLAGKASIKPKGFTLHKVTEERYDPLDPEINIALGIALKTPARSYHSNTFFKLYALAGLKQYWRPNARMLYAQLGGEFSLFRASFIYNYYI